MQDVERFHKEQHGIGFKIITSSVINSIFFPIYLIIWMQSKKNAWITEMKIQIKAVKFKG